MPKPKNGGRPGGSGSGGSAFKRSNASTNPHRRAPSKASGNRKKGTNLRTKTTIKRVNMYRGGHAIRDKKGKIVHGGAFADKHQTGGRDQNKAVGRTAPNRKWFGNTRVVGQTQLDKFREELSKTVHDPYTVVLHKRKLPMGLVTDSAKVTKMNLLSTSSFGETFGPKRTRKRPKLGAAVSSLEALMADAAGKRDQYDTAAARGKVDTHTEEAKKDDGTRKIHTARVFDKGQSRRIWNELYKVLDCSDVVVQVLDARNPLGTRSRHVEAHLKKDAKHLVPVWLTRRWVDVLGREYPTLAFHANVNNPFGKGSLINLLRQFSQLHKEKQQISVGFIGYPNVGKSSIINTLKKKRVCKAAPIPGETKVWQYITLMKRVFLIDCPGVVPPTGETNEDIVLKGVCRTEKLPNPEDFVEPILRKCKREFVTSTYGIGEWDDHIDFLKQLAVKAGKLLPQGEPNVSLVARMVLDNWNRGKLPFFVEPPRAEDDPERRPDSSVGASGTAVSGSGEGEDGEEASQAAGAPTSGVPQLPDIQHEDYSRLGNVSIFGHGVTLTGGDNATQTGGQASSGAEAGQASPAAEAGPSSPAAEAGPSSSAVPDISWDDLPFNQ